MIYKLVLKNEVPGLNRRSWTFKPPVLLGRDPDSNLCINHHSISRQHCQFSLNGDEGLVIKDLGSTNGIYVDDNRIQQHVLMPNQVVQIGALELEIQFSSPDELAASQHYPREGNVDRTRPLPVYQLDAPPDPKPWWRRVLG
ncbi:FHA domain-containing protein [Novipirellula rosea]|uniref:FHA domain-containing protein n=1 Tax=Novipirellula rosea TaxID=1031540 RepID=A0ABP8NV16_9BACT